MISLGWRVSNRREELRDRLAERDLLNRIHSEAVAMQGLPMAQVLLIAKQVKDAEVRVEDALRAYAAAVQEMNEAAEDAAGEPR